MSVLEKHTFQGQSSYGAEFPEKAPSRAEKYVTPDNIRVSNNKFEGESTYLSNYVPGSAERTKPVERPPSNTGLGKGRFEGISSYNQEFQKGAENQRPEKIVRKNEISLSDSPF